MLFSIYIFIIFQRIFSSYDSNELDFIANESVSIGNNDRTTFSFPFLFLIHVEIARATIIPGKKGGRERKEKCQRGLETIKSLPMTVSLSFLLARGVVYLRARSSIVFIPVYDGVGLYFQKNHRFLLANVYADM